MDAVIRNAVICEVFRLEQDIRDHTRIEETILMPRVAEMEHVAPAEIGITHALRQQGPHRDT